MRGKKVKISWLDVVILGVLTAIFLWIGWQITYKLNYQWNWQVIPNYFFWFDQESQKWMPGMLMSGILTTLRISIWAILAALLFGTFMAVLRTGQNRFLRMVTVAYVALIRNIPVLVWIFISYYFIADKLIPILGIDRIQNIDEGFIKSVIVFLTGPISAFSLFFAGMGSLAFYEGAYIAEIIRAGIEDVDKGQWEASAALGFNRMQQMHYIILPQAFKTILPPLAGQVISTIKDSAIVSVISIPELTFQGMEMMSATFLTFEIWITIMLIYFVICFCCSMAISYVEKKMHRTDPIKYRIKA